VPSQPDIQVLTNVAAVASAAADSFVQSAEAAIADHGEFNVCLSGGSTPKLMYELLAASPRVDQVAGHKVRFYFGDERCVPPDHPDSNYGLAKRMLLEHVRHCVNCVYRMEGERDPHEAAKDYGRLLVEKFGNDWPRFDLVFLGMGDDGHTASLFPGTAALNEMKHRCVANFVPKLDAWRLTLTYPVFNAAAQVAFLITGASKAGTLRAVLEGPFDPQRLPSQGVRPTDGKLIYLVDEAAAAQLRGRKREGQASP
jgi:6-phosphogluconolactonase